MLVYWLELILLSCGLAMDALAVAIAMGVNWKQRFTPLQIFVAAFLFGVFQAGMPVLGWYGGKIFENAVSTYGAWISCLLLCFIGVKMIIDSRAANDEKLPSFSFKELLVLAFATSVDALLVGVSYACMGTQNIITEISVIGIITFILSLIGCILGKVTGHFFGKKFAMVGGLVLIGIGIKFLFS